jgi:flavin reductase (DIM6/NTAB) family NADH-FMN oxidoreductase RutF
MMISPGRETNPPAVGGAALRKTLGIFPTGVTIIATLDEAGRPVGLTVNSFSSVSLDPPLVLWSLRDSSMTSCVFRKNTRFTISILADDQEELSRRFAAPTADKFDGLVFDRGLGCLPLMSGAAAWLECVTEMTYPGGDHTIFVGRVAHCAISGKPPLVFCQGSYLRSSAAPHSQVGRRMAG